MRIDKNTKLWVISNDEDACECTLKDVFAMARNMDENDLIIYTTAAEAERHAQLQALRNDIKSTLGVLDEKQLKDLKDFMSRQPLSAEQMAKLDFKPPSSEGKTTSWPRY